MNREQHLQKTFPLKDGTTYIQSLDKFNEPKGEGLGSESLKEKFIDSKKSNMKNKMLEELSDKVRKGDPIDLSDAIKVIKYQTEIKHSRIERTNKRLRIIKSIVAVVCSAIGGMGIVFGEIDDSPGLGGIGMIIIAVTMYLNAKLVNEK